MLKNMRQNLYIFIGIPLVVFCWLGLIIAAGGFHYEHKKFGAMLFTTVFVLLFQYIVGDPIKFIIQAYIMTVKKGKRHYHYGIPRTPVENDNIRVLRMHINWGKARLKYNWRHRDEKLNMSYRETANDIYFYGSYFIPLMAFVFILFNPLQYYYSEGIRQSLILDTTSKFNLNGQQSIHNTYEYIKLIVIEPFFLEDENDFIKYGWMHDAMGKLIGVIKLTQLRLENTINELHMPDFSDQDFLPGWNLPYNKYKYREKYYQTFEPWLFNSTDLDYTAPRYGVLTTYPNKIGYTVELTRSKTNNEVILKYLYDYNWINENTAVIFVEFTVYNVDSNIFAHVMITLESTPFYFNVLSVHVHTAVLLLDWKFWHWFLLLIYALNLIKLTKNIILKVWYRTEEEKFLSFWNFLDCCIIILNFVLFFLVLSHEGFVLKLLDDVEVAPKAKYFDFYKAFFKIRVIETVFAVLACVSIFRAWKAFFFLRVTRLYVRTLELGAVDFFWTLFNLLLFLFGFVLSSYVITTLYRTSSHSPISFIHLLSFSLGYTEVDNPMETINLHSNPLGLISHVVVMFSITLVLTNMLITLVSIHYATAKEEERKRGPIKISFWEFLHIEYNFLFTPFAKLKKLIRQEKVLDTIKITKVDQNRRMEDCRPISIEKQQSYLRRIRISNDILSLQIEMLKNKLTTLGYNMSTNAKPNANK